MNILALDLGTRTGWALMEHGRIESGVQVFDVKRGESPGMRYLRFNTWLDEMLVKVVPGLNAPLRPRVDLCVYEQSHHRGGAATEIAAGLATRVQEGCARAGIEHAAVHSATLKKFVTGKGNADKGVMQDHAIARGWLEDMVAGRRDGYDDNEVDAICLLHYALIEMTGREFTGRRPGEA